jgi:transcriptional regulator with XRE-family HTH domain
MPMSTKSVQKKWSPVLIRRLRGKRTQQQFAQLIGVPKNTVWRWEAGQCTPAPAYAQKLSHIAAQERFLLDWQPVGSIVWVGDLEAGAADIANDFSRSLARGPHRAARRLRIVR